MAQQLLLPERGAPGRFSLFSSLSSEIWHAGQSPGRFPNSPSGYAFGVHWAQAPSTEDIGAFPFHSDIQGVFWGPFPWSAIYQVFALPTDVARRTNS